jgi:AcrR family transcriptional regulator
MAGTGPDAGPPVPAAIWELPEVGERGPKPRHSRVAIAAVAVRIADAEGMEAVSMRRVAAAVGMGTMSLYNYVPAKDHLVQLMIDQAGGEYAYPAGAPPDARAAIADLAQQGREIARRHPWLAGLLQRPRPLGPNAFRYLDHFLGLLAGTGLDTGAKMEVIALINGFSLMYGSMEAAVAEEGAAGGATAEQQAAAQVAALVGAAASGRYPNLAAALAAGGAPRDSGEVFRSAVLRLIDGLIVPRPAG